MTENDSDIFARLRTKKHPCYHLWLGPPLEFENSAGEKVVSMFCIECGAWAVDALRETA